MALICTGKCYECGKEIQSRNSDEHYFCRECFKRLADDKKIERCPDCGTWHYSRGDCLCGSAFYQCGECGRWVINGDECICQLKETPKEYEKKSTNTDAEKIFKKKLKSVLKGTGYSLETQQPLIQLVKTTKYRKWVNELHRYIDFVIFDDDTEDPVLLIEYNDSTHDNPDRKKRDEKVKGICEQAGYKLIFIKRDDNMSESVLRAKLECFLDL